jgi:hypothetical protein
MFFVDHFGEIIGNFVECTQRNFHEVGKIRCTSHFPSESKYHFIVINIRVKHHFTKIRLPTVNIYNIYAFRISVVIGLRILNKLYFNVVLIYLFIK